jgi:hypothetical protein
MPLVKLNIDGKNIEEVLSGYVEIVNREADTLTPAPATPAVRSQNYGEVGYQEASDHLPVVRFHVMIGLNRDKKEELEKWALAPAGKAWKKVVMEILQEGRTIQKWTMHHGHVIGYKMVPEDNPSLAGTPHGDQLHLILRGNIKPSVKPANYTENDIVELT